MVVRVPKFNSQLFLFEKRDNKHQPIKKIQLSQKQKDLLINQGWLMVRPKTRFLMLVPGKDELVSNKVTINLYKPVVDATNGKIIILGMYKVDENELEEPKAETIH